MYKLIELFNQLNFRWPLFAFIKNGLFNCITLSKWPLSMIFALSKNAIMKDFSLYQKPSLLAFTKNGLF